MRVKSIKSQLTVKAFLAEAAAKVHALLMKESYQSLSQIGTILRLFCLGDRRSLVGGGFLELLCQLVKALLQLGEILSNHCQLFIRFGKLIGGLRSLLTLRFHNLIDSVVLHNIYLSYNNLKPNVRRLCLMMLQLNV